MKKAFILAAVVIVISAMSMHLIQNIDDSFAKKYAKNQATTQASNCGNNGADDANSLPHKRAAAGGDTSCQNTNSQIQGDDNSVSLAEVHYGS